MPGPKALLVNPPTGNYIRDDRCQAPVENSSSVLRAPIDLAYMAAEVEARGGNARIVDYPAEGLGWDSLRHDLASYRPELLIVSATTPTLPGDMDACRLAKELDPSTLTLAKGAHVTTHDEETLERFEVLDVAMRGECEEVLGELIDAGGPAGIPGLSYRDGSGIVRNPDRTHIANLDELPLPARHLLNNRLYVRPDTGEPQTTIHASRGCPARCIYCLVPTLSGIDVAFRAPERIVEEMRLCVRRYGIRNFYFRADTFTLKKSWTLELCERIRASGLDVAWVSNSRVDTMDRERAEAMRAAGCWMVGFGVETGSAELLERMRKGATLEQAEQAVAACREAGIKTYLFWVLGTPWETEETVRETMTFARRLDADFCEFHVAYPFPGTPLYDRCAADGLLETAELTGHDMKRPVARSYALSSRDLKRLQRRAVWSYYLRPSYIARTLRGLDSPTKLWNYAREGLRVLAHP